MTAAVDQALAALLRGLAGDCGLPTEENGRPIRLNNLADQLKAAGVVEAGGTVIRANTELLEVRAGGGDEERVAIVRDADGDIQRLRTKNLVLALGKVGAAREAEIERLGIGLTNQPIYTGVRFEAASQGLDSLFGLTKDPKYNPAPS